MSSWFTITSRVLLLTLLRRCASSITAASQRTLPSTLLSVEGLSGAGRVRAAQGGASGSAARLWRSRTLASKPPAPQ
jgi:hypothetical protein